MKQIKKFELFCEGKEDTQLDWILDKINKFGENSLSNAEKEILKGTVSAKKSDPHYNKYITKLLTDLKNREITEEIAKQFVEKYVTKEDLFSVLLQLLKDGKINHLVSEDITKNNEME